MLWRLNKLDLCGLFTESAPLGRFSHRVAMTICGYVVVCHRVHFLFLGLSLDLRSHDPFQASHCTMRKKMNLFINIQGEPLIKNVFSGTGNQIYLNHWLCFYWSIWVELVKGADFSRRWYTQNFSSLAWMVKKIFICASTHWSFKTDAGYFLVYFYCFTTSKYVQISAW